MLDEFTRECLAIEVAHSISAQTVVDLLTWLALTRGTPKHIRSDSGSECTAKAVQGWLEQTGCATIYISGQCVGESVYRELHGEAQG